MQVERIGHIPKSRVSKLPVARLNGMESLKSRKMVLTSKLSEKQGSGALVVMFESLPRSCYNVAARVDDAEAPRREAWLL